MSHPDEGTIQALLDGELSPEERTALETHFLSCASCAARMEEARGFMDEADRLVEVLAVPARRAARSERARPRVVFRTLAWAATIVLAVGVGYYGRGTAPPSTAILHEGGTVSAVAPAPAAKQMAAADQLVSNQPEPEPDQPKESDRTAMGRTQATAESKDASALAAAAPPPLVEREMREARANEAPQKAARLADEAGPAWQVISMEEAVRLLAGQIRLIDGLIPERVESGPGTAVAGADPMLTVVRVVYASGNVLLDQQRPADVPAIRQESAARASGGAVRSDASGWRESSGVRFVVTGSVSADSIQELVLMVR